MKMLCLIRNEDLGKLILRLSVGILVLLHGYAKLVDGGAQLNHVSGLLAQTGLPAFLAYGVFLGEVLGPVFVILGLFTRLGALLIVGNMVVALALAHVDHLFALSKFGGWASELQGMFLFGALAIVFLGSGRYAVWSCSGKGR